MIIDKKGKLFGKISIIDLLIVLIIVVAIGGVTYKVTKSNTATIFTKPNQIEMVLATDDVDTSVLKTIKDGAVVKDRVSNVVLGKLKVMTTADAKIQGINDDGQVVVSSRPDHVSVRIVCSASGIYSENGPSSISNVNYYVNRSLEVTVDDVVLWLRIQEINKVD